MHDNDIFENVVSTHSRPKAAGNIHLNTIPAR